MNHERFNKLTGFLKTVRLGWIIPVILLIRGEDPKTQVRAIFSGIIVPLLAIVIFLGLWNSASKQIVTKFGTVPGPRQVLSAWGSLMNEKRLEQIKEADHVRRLREKRMRYLDKYATVVASIPDKTPDFGDSETVGKALDVASRTFDEVNEILEVSNRVSVAPNETAARDVVEGFEFDSAKRIGDAVIANLLPVELAYKNAEEEFNTSAEYVGSPDDSEAALAGKSERRKRRSKELAGMKADLLIERQKTTTEATQTALAVIGAIPRSTQSTLKSVDRRSTQLAPILTTYLSAVEAQEATTGTKFKDKSKLKLLEKTFGDKPYPGKDTYVSQIGTSLKTVFAGFIIASMIAIPIGILCGLNKSINNAFNPIIQIFKPVSPLAWLPIVMIVVGALYVTDDPAFEISFINSAITVALCSLWPTLVNTAVGVASTDKDFLNVARVLKLSWTKKVWNVVLPSSLPMVFTGLRLSLGVGWMVLIAAEMLAQNPGLGKFVWDMFQNGSSETLSMIMVAVFTIGIIGFFLDTIMLSLQQLVSFGDAV